MSLPESLQTVFSGQIEERDGGAVIPVPERELRFGELAVGDTYRIAVLSKPEGGEPATEQTTAGQPRHSPDDTGRPVAVGDVHEVEIEELGDQGDGIARVGPGFVVFVPDTKVGDRVTVEISRVRENFGIAEVVEEEPIKG